MIFWFHLAVLALILFIICLEVWATGRRALVPPVLALISLFMFHCLYWGRACTGCDLGNPVCVLEVGLFWAFVLWGIYLKLKRRR